MTKPRILWLHRQLSAVGAYRCLYPARELQRQGYDITFFEKPYTSLKPDLQSWMGANIGKYDLLMVDRAVNSTDLPVFAGFRHSSPDCRMAVDFDDNWMEVPWWNQAHVNYKPGMSMYEAGRAHLKLSELVTVSTPTLVEQFKARAHDIVCCLNGIEASSWMDLPINPERQNDPHLRILYGGAAGHYGDLDSAKLGLESVIENPPVPWRLICFGAIPAWLHNLQAKYPSRVLRLPWVEFEDYPQAIRWGGFDGAIAPLTEHIFNEAKSNIKWLEAGIQDIPFLCSDVGPYIDIPRGCALKISNTAVQWAEGLRNLLLDASLREKLRKNAKEVILDKWTISKTAPMWEAAIERAMSRPRIETLEDTRLPSEVIPEQQPDNPDTTHSDSHGVSERGRNDRRSGSPSGRS